LLIPFDFHSLFGSEDVDLRREILVVKPGVIVVEDDSMDECDVDKVGLA